MSLESATDAIRRKAALAPPLGYAVKFDLGANGVVFWDGRQTPPVIDNAPRDADTTISLSLADLDALAAGTLDPTMAYMTGRLKVAGSLGVAMKVNQLLGE
jgi:putative sterol carrier protein